MKRSFLFMITIILSSILIISSITLYSAHEQIFDANEEFENFIEVYRANDFEEKVLNAFQSSKYSFSLSSNEEMHYVSMTYQIKVINKVLHKELKATLLSKK